MRLFPRGRAFEREVRVVGPRLRISCLADELQATSFSFIRPSGPHEQSLFLDPDYRAKDSQKMRIGFSSLVREIKLPTRILWSSLQNQTPGYHQIYAGQIEAPLIFTLENGAQIEVVREAASWREFVGQNWKSVLAAGIVLAHLILVLMTQMTMSLDLAHSEEMVDISKIQTQVVKLSAGRMTQVTARAQNHSENLLKGFRIGGKSMGVRKASYEEPSPFGTSKPKSQDLFGYRTEEPVIESAESVDIDAAAILQLLRPYQAKLKECYDEALFVDAQLQGRAELILRAQASGVVERIEVTGLSGSPQSQVQMTNCFRRTLAQLRLPATTHAFAVSQALVLMR